nr:ribonuclease H-like domain-containing protein [Tanacetum cinerariifolium]
EDGNPDRANVKQALGRNVSIGWVVDSGTNQHMTTSAKFLINVVDVSNLGLTGGQPNGTKAKIVKIRDLKHNDYVTLFKVLIVSEYTVNLLYVRRLAKDSKFFVGFDENKCYTQDLKRNIIIGTSDMDGGVYLFDATCKQFVSNLSATSYVSKTLWHNRFGHLADQVLQLLKDDLKFNHNKSATPCDVDPTRSPVKKVTSPLSPLLMIIPGLYEYICLKASILRLSRLVKESSGETKPKVEEMFTKYLQKENILCNKGHKDHLSACDAYMLYCITTFNLAHFVANQMFHCKRDPNEVLPYGLFLSNFFEIIRMTRLRFVDERYISYDLTMDPLSNPSNDEIIEDYRCGLHHHHDHDHDHDHN